MILVPSLPMPPVPAAPARPALPEAGEWLHLALTVWLPMSGGLGLETLFDRLEARA